MLALDAPVNARLRTWRIPDNDFTRGRPVTLRHLLTHSAGLSVSGFPGYAAGVPVPTLVQVLDGEAPSNTPAVRVTAVPGTRFAYSGGGMTVMQLLLTDVSGRPFTQFMRERVLDPLGMRASTYEQPLPEARRLQAATGYARNGDPVAGRYHTYPEMAAAGLWSTPTDLARWILAIQASLAGAARPLLSRALASAMVSPGVDGRGLGVELKEEGGDLTFGHGGANAGFRGQFVGFARQRRGVVVMTNSDAGSRIATELVHAIAREHGWPGFEPRTITPVPTTPAGLGAYAGTYGAGESKVQVTTDGVTLSLVLPWGERRELVPLGEDRVESPEGGTGTFSRDAGGRVIALTIGRDRLERER